MTDAGRLPDDEPRPWERPGAVRRDCEPHRGRWFTLLAWGNVVVLALSAGVVGLTVACLRAPSLFRAAPLLVGALPLPLGTLTWGLAVRDLGRMRAGVMDPAGRGPTNFARQQGLAGLVIGAAFALFALLVLSAR